MKQQNRIRRRWKVSETLTYESPRSGSSLPGQWGGNISSSTWRADARTVNASWYDYGYDLLGRLTQADYGGDVASMADYTRSYTYDLNGNMTGREYIQYGECWTHYVGNAPLSWTCDEPAPPGPPPGLRSGPPPVEDVLEEMYTYDANGSLMTVRDDQGDTLRVTRYNLLNLPEEYANASGGTVNYVYSADGEKLYVEENPSGGAVQGTEYAANYRIENGAVTMIHTDAGYYTPVTAQGGPGVSYSHILTRRTTWGQPHAGGREWLRRRVSRLRSVRRRDRRMPYGKLFTADSPSTFLQTHRPLVPFSYRRDRHQE